MSSTMSGGFAELLKLSRTQTAQSELLVQSQIASHQLRLEKKRREQEARDRKEREVAAVLRAKRLEEQQKEEQRKLKREEEKRAREQELARREEEMRNALKYGPRKASAGRAVRAKADSDRIPRPTNDEPRESRNATDVLTREEKRLRKVAAAMRRSAASATTSSRRKTKEPTALLPNGRTVRRLPGGAVDYTTVSRLVDPDAGIAVAPPAEGKSARERLAAIPSTLTKLNTVKRDRRTIDEILVDRAKARQAKTLAGDEAKEFSDWFGKNKKKEAQPAPQPQTKPSAASSPASNHSSPAPSANISPPAKSKHAPRPSASFLKPINPKPNALFRPAVPAPSSASAIKKRARSPSPTPSASPAPKRRGATRAADLGSQIWSIFGKDKRTYVARDVLSDDEDMEADAASVLKEEIRSARIAHKEDSVVLASERRREEEKRRRKKERERRQREPMA